ncbi:stimulus-sensing domain-containing protein [Hirschia baltica]|uniref:histidine kinase n=1 Tax=Hirschia baltica (strain ATCC 49814 / DSM 5838 / IFAM 1418) TaxID=582402 RepID=C6XL61_HIRBI|nr:stimulus-sensing domain-containing protein [Hirschia baltica]ACT57890.1 histidine kinase [Hirschia baltica ATCC 49814]
MANTDELGLIQSAMRTVRSLFTSRIARLILASNLAGLLILITGALFVNEIRAGLVQARTESLEAQALTYESVLSLTATSGTPRPTLNESLSRSSLKRLQAPPHTRVRLYSSDLKLIADSFLLEEFIKTAELPPLKKPGLLDRWAVGISRHISNVFNEESGATHASAAKSLEEELSIALSGKNAAAQRFSERGERLISVSVPVRYVSAVVGVLTVEASDVEDIIRAERAALAPIISVAVLMSLITSFLLTAGIARPLRRLSIAADRVRSGKTNRLDMSGISKRKDEIGDLAKALDAMTGALHDRIVLNERFAADVAHELKNPLTSIRSAVETSEAVEDENVRERMRQVISRDVVRLDRLITDISNASRLEAEIAREKATNVDVQRLLEDLVSIWRDTRKEGQPEVELNIDTVEGPLILKAREGPLAQVIRNLVENARSFSPEDGVVTITAVREPKAICLTFEDQGPGVPEDKLEKIFERFYSDRPKGAKFGNNSGLGLSIVKQIVETHYGEVFVQNLRQMNADGSEGEVLGAQFVVRLPVR